MPKRSILVNREEKTESRNTLCSPMGVEHSGEGIVGCRSHNAKLFKRIEHSGSR